MTESERERLRERLKQLTEEYRALTGRSRCQTQRDAIANRAMEILLDVYGQPTIEKFDLPSHWPQMTINRNWNGVCLVCKQQGQKGEDVAWDSNRRRHWVHIGCCK